MIRNKIVNNEEKKFRALEVRDWLQENRLDKKMCKWCGENPPNLNDDYCSESCASNNFAW